MLYLQCLASLTTPSIDSKPKKELPILYLQCLASLTPPFQDMKQRQQTKERTSNVISLVFSFINYTKYRQQTKERTSNIISLVFSFINSTISGYEVDSKPKKELPMLYLQCLASLTPPFQDMKQRQQTKERTSNIISLVFSFINSTISGYEVETANQRKNFQCYISSVQLH